MLYVVKYAWHVAELSWLALKAGRMQPGSYTELVFSYRR